jgi:hypothetical protein
VSARTSAAGAFLAALALLAPAARGDEPPSPAQLEAERYVPLVVTSITHQGDVPALDAPVIAAVSESLQRGIMRGYGRQLYARGPAFTQATEAPGPLTIVGNVLKAIDDTFEREFAASVAPILAKMPPQSQWSFAVEGLLAKGPFNVRSVADRLSGHPLTLVWEALRGRFKRTNPVAAAVIDPAAGMAVADAQDLPQGPTPLYDQGDALYVAMSDGQQKRFLPLYLKVQVTVNTKALSLKATVNVKPGELLIPGFARTPRSPIQVQTLRYAPSHYDPNFRSLMQVTLERTYGGPDARRPMLGVAFGRQATKDVRGLTICAADCTRYIYKVPTIVVEMQWRNIHDILKKAADAALAEANDQAGWDAWYDSLGAWHWMIEGFYKAWGNGVQMNITSARDALDSNIARTMRAWGDEEIPKYTTFYLLIEKLAIDLKDPRGPCVRPDLSNTPLVAKVVNPVTGRPYWVTISRQNSQKDLSWDMSYLPGGPGKIGGSINLFESLFADQISEAFTKDMRQAIANMDRQADNALRGALGPVMDLIGP